MAVSVLGLQDCLNIQALEVEKFHELQHAEVVVVRTCANHL